MKTVRFVVALALVLSWSVVGTAADEGSACCAMPGEEGIYKVVTSDELLGMLVSRAYDLVVIDARTSEEYQQAHIKGAISIPLELLEKDAKLLSAPKDAKLVFYCNGINCGKGKQSANIAIAQGYRDVSVYVDGMPVWQEKAYPLARTIHE